MKTSAALLLAVGSCAAGFLAGWLVHSGGTCKIELPPTQPLQRAEAPEVSKAASDRAPELDKPDSRVVIQPAASEPPAPASVAKPAEIAKAPVPADPSDPRNLPESTLAEMTKKLEAVRSYLNARTAPIIMQRFEDGLSEHVSDEHSWTGGNSDWERATIYGLQQRPEVPGWNRTVLPRDQYPELYVYKDETLRLQELIDDARIAEFQQAAGQKK